MAQKVALVTGAAQGIGRAIAALLAERGYHAVVADLEAGKPGFTFVRTDVASEPSVRACVRSVVKRFGRLDALVNNAGIASTRALQSEADTEAYAAAKAGLVGLTHALAMSLGAEVRVNCVSPGWIAKQAVRRKDHAQHPVGRVGRGEDIAGIVAYLLSDAAGFVTGQNFVIDGGMTKKMIYID